MRVNPCMSNFKYFIKNSFEIAEIIFTLHSVKFEMISQYCLSVRKFISSSAQSNGKSFPRWLSVRKNALGVDVALESGFKVLIINIL
jgi:hypothetical protein